MTGGRRRADRPLVERVSGYIPPWRPESNAQNHAVNTAVARAASAYAHDGYTVIVDGINGPWLLDHLLTNLEPLPDAVHYVIVRCDPDVAVARVRDRPDTPEATSVAGFRTIDEAAVRFMHQRFVDVNIPPDQILDTTALSPAQALTAYRALLDAGRLRVNR